MDSESAQYSFGTGSTSAIENLTFKMWKAVELGSVSKIAQYWTSGRLSIEGQPVPRLYRNMQMQIHAALETGMIN